MINKKIEEVKKGRIECDCPCPGPFCDIVMHPCSKPDEHYTQREAMYIEFLEEIKIKINE